MKQKPITHQIDGLAALLLFGVFAVCVLAVLLTGASAYRRLTLRDQQSYNRRTCTLYLAQHLRQADTLNGVWVDDLDGTAALALSDLGGEYVTWIYCYDGYLMELYADREGGFGPEAGEQIMPAQSVEFTLEDGLLTVVLTATDGQTDELLLSLRSGEGAAA